MKRALLTIAVLLGLTLGLAHSATDAVDSMNQRHSFKRKITQQVQLDYLLSLPPGYQHGGQRWPLILFLHGAGERGTNLSKVSVHGPPKLVKQGKELPFIIVSPQCPTDGIWDDAALLALLDEVSKNYRVDSRRIYLTGLYSLTGTLKGELEVKLTKRKGEPFASVRAGGELQLSEGQFDFCAAKGSAVGTVVFNPNVPPIEASVRGTLTGKAGEVPLDVEVTGRLSDPGLIFKHVNMRPQDLGKVIATAGADKLSPAERAAWTLKLSLTFGVFAANHQNPFEGQDLGEIFFSFRAGE